jgi:hypothetical protein
VIKHLAANLGGFFARFLGATKFFFSAGISEISAENSVTLRQILTPIKKTAIFEFKL